MKPWLANSKGRRMTDHTFFLESILIGLILVILYELLYRWQRRFFINRLYLLLSGLLMAITPLIGFELIPIMTLLPEAFTSSDVVGVQNIAEVSRPIDWLLITYLLGVGIFFIAFCAKLVHLFFRLNGAKFEQMGSLLVARGNYNSAFSFFNYIFLDHEDNNQVMAHETVHSNRKHSIDRLLLELLNCLLWFNPIFYRLKFLIAENHEFEADSETIHGLDIGQDEYADNMIGYLKKINRKSVPLTHDFHSIIKNRVKMIFKKQEPRNVAYLMIIPIFITVLSAFTVESYPVYVAEDGSLLNDSIPESIVTVIDTVATFDPATGKESVRIVKNLASSKDFFNNLKFSGKMYTITDTITQFDFETYVETVTVNKTMVPIELGPILSLQDPATYEEIIKKYGKKVE